MQTRTPVALVALLTAAACSNANSTDPGGSGGSRATSSATGGSGGSDATRDGSSSASSSAGTGGRSSGDTGQGGSSTGAGGRGAATSGAGGQGGASSSRSSASSAGGGGQGGSKTDTAATGGASGSGGNGGSAGATGSGGGAGAGGVPGSDAGADAGSGTQHWVGTWTASPYYDSGNQPPTSLSNAVLRQIVHVSLGGSRIRVQFSNLSGNGSAVINSAHVALCKSASTADSTIDTATDKALSFSGKASVTLSEGNEVWSDPVDLVVPALANLTITTAFGSVPSHVVGHSGSRTTSYLQSGSTTVDAASMASAQATDHWYYIAGVDVMADASARGIVAIGDSITDGRGTDTNKNNRWTDVLAARLQANAATAGLSVMNEAIGATNLVGEGTAAEARFARDVLGQSGVHYVIVYDGVNDVGGDASFASMKTVYDKLISQAHGQGLLIFGGTLLPFNGNSYYTAAHESVRQQVNTYIKSGAFDGVIDFDAALTDGGDPPKLQSIYATWSQTDWLHPGPAGYQKMGNTVDLALFAK